MNLQSRTLTRLVKFEEHVPNKCLAKPSRSLLLTALYNQLRFSGSKHFHFHWTKKHFISEWYFPKHHLTGSLVVRKDKKIVILDQLGSRRAIADLFVRFTTCLSPGRVKKLQKFITSVSKLAIVLIWNVQSPHELTTYCPVKGTKS